LRPRSPRTRHRNRYAAVFPIKVNQQRLVVEEVYGYGKEFGFGLEVGSKPELLAVMAMTEGESERMIICNGFKDDSYIEAVILATKLGRTIIPVVENFGEPADPQARGGVRCPPRMACESSCDGVPDAGAVVGREIEVQFVTEIRACAAQVARDGRLPAARARHAGSRCRTSVVSGRRQRARVYASSS
jgi:hypothetical protein